MALIPGENSFVTVAEADAYAAAHGLSSWPQPPGQQDPGEPVSEEPDPGEPDPGEPDPEEPDPEGPEPDEAEPGEVEPGQDDSHLAAKEAALIRAADWLNTLAWRGARVEWDQPLCWPRKGMVFEGVKVPEDAVPEQVKAAQMEAAALLLSGKDLFAAQERSGRIQQETVGPITVRYFDDASAGAFFPALAGLLAPFLTQIPGRESSASYRVLEVAP